MHVLFPDGVFTRAAGERRAELRETPAPTPGELTAVATRVRDRMVTWLRARELLDAYVVQPGSPAALDAFVQMTLGLGRLSELDDHGAEREAVDARRFGQRASGPHVGEADGFSVHAGVRVAAGDSAGLERLARYCARPAVSLERLSLLPDGRLAYRVKWARRGGPTHRIMTPLEFLARLAALLPPPRHPLVRFHGVLAPHSPWRSSVVPDAVDSPVHGCRADTEQSPADAPPASREKGLPGDPGLVRRVQPAAPTGVAADERADRGGRVATRVSRIDWATLLKRTYDVDVLACEGCGGRLRLVAVITDATTAREVLASLGLDATVPPVARARSPDDGLGASSAGGEYADPPAPLD